MPVIWAGAGDCGGLLGGGDVWLGPLPVVPGNHGLPRIVL